MYGIPVASKVFPVPERFPTLIDGALERRVVFFAVRVEFMTLSKCQPAFLAPQGIFDVVLIKLQSRRLCTCAQIELLRDTIAIFSVR